MATLPELLVDLDDEYVELRRLLEHLPPDAAQWDLATPAEGWAVRDQVSHLAFFDDAGRLALVEPEAFAEEADQAMARGGDPMEEHLLKGRTMDGDQLLSWWGRAHRGMADALALADPGARVPWYGPPMGLLSFVSARLMETWAHGQDVADALHHRRVPTDRLRHIAHLGVRARPFSYVARGRELPSGRIDVVLTAPSGEPWRWEIGDAGPDSPPAASVRGSALDFCLLVTQRRNLADTGLVATGDQATDWMGLAQAFAGPPGPGRPPLGAGLSADP
jgi:uncharacterized protein (TIGR03084 family)